MNKRKAISNLFTTRLFWDVDLSRMEVDKSSRIIIERVFSLGTIEEIQTLFDYYGKEKIIQTLTNLNYLDPKTLNFACLIFNLPKNEFRCYMRRQLQSLHWNS